MIFNDFGADLRKFLKNVSQCITVRCSVLQCVAVCANQTQFTMHDTKVLSFEKASQKFVVACCAVCCSVLCCVVL